MQSFIKITTCCCWVIVVTYHIRSNVERWSLRTHQFIVTQNIHLWFWYYAKRLSGIVSDWTNSHYLIFIMLLQSSNQRAKSWESLYPNINSNDEAEEKSNAKRNVVKARSTGAGRQDQLKSSSDVSTGRSSLDPYLTTTSYHNRVTTANSKVRIVKNTNSNQHSHALIYKSLYGSFIHV